MGVLGDFWCCYGNSTTFALKETLAKELISFWYKSVALFPSDTVAN